MKCNANLVDLIEKVKPEIRTLIEKCNTVSRSVTYSWISSSLSCMFGIGSSSFILWDNYCKKIRRNSERGVTRWCSINPRSQRFMWLKVKQMVREQFAHLIMSRLLFLNAVLFFVQVKMWVQLLIPRIEDGNNFGVSIQEETVAELRTVEGEAASYLDQISRFEPEQNSLCLLYCFIS